MCGAAVVTGRTRGIGAVTAIAQKDWGKIDAAVYGSNDEWANTFTAKTAINNYKWDLSESDAGYFTGPTLSANDGQHRN